MAQEKYGFFNSAVDDERAYDAVDMARAFRALTLDGVAALNNTCLKVTAEGSTMRTQVGYGQAIVQGYHYELSDDGAGVYAITHSTTESLDRIDRIVLRLDLEARTVVLMKLVGTAAATPEAPALTRTDTVHELSLAQVRVRVGATELLTGDITDERGDDTVCGAMIPQTLALSTLWQKLIDAGNVDALRYAVQTLTAAQQDQARANLAALGFADILNVLTSDATDKTLSAAQGKALKALVDGKASQEAVNGKASVAQYTATLPAAGWSGSGPYTQTVAVSGLLASDIPVADVVLSDTAATAQAQLEAYGYVGRMDTAENALTVTCYEEAPALDLTLALRVVR